MRYGGCSADDMRALTTLSALVMLSCSEVHGTNERTVDNSGRPTVEAGIPVNPLMKMFGIEMDNLLSIKPGRGVTVSDNDLILDPEQLVPPPLIRGKVSAVRVTDGMLVQTFGSGKRLRLSPPAVSRNCIYWRGNELQFGKLTMIETDLELVDEDPPIQLISQLTIGTISWSRDTSRAPRPAG